MIDRRVQKTLQALHQALISLILEKGYDAITVQDIIDRANVGRSTFYSHYLGKEQLLQSGLDDLRKLLVTDQKDRRFDRADRHVHFGFTLALFEHAHGYREVYRAMVGKHAGAVVINRMKALLTELVKADLATTKLDDQLKDVPRSALIQFVVGAIMSMLIWWVDEKTKVSPAEIDAIFRRLTLPALGKMAG